MPSSYQILECPVFRFSLQPRVGYELAVRIHWMIGFRPTRGPGDAVTYLSGLAPSLTAGIGSSDNHNTTGIGRECLLLYREDHTEGGLNNWNHFGGSR